jgi:predicted nuclease with TOPRIM domain
MATTKILKPDLGLDLQQLLTDLDNAKGTKASLTERLDGVDSELTTVGGEISTLQSDVSNLQTSIANVPQATDVNALKTQMKELAEYGNFNQAFTYDTNGNVKTETVTGDVSYTETYYYKDAVAGTLDYSTKVYTDENGKTVTIKKVYTYDAATGNITGIAVTTTIA